MGDLAAGEASSAHLPDRGWVMARQPGSYPAKHGEREGWAPEWVPSGICPGRFLGRAGVGSTAAVEQLELHFPQSDWIGPAPGLVSPATSAAGFA